MLNIFLSFFKSVIYRKIIYYKILLLINNNKTKRYLQGIGIKLYLINL